MSRLYTGQSRLQPVKSRLQPGRMLLVDTTQGRIIGDDELKESYAARQPYGEWLRNQGRKSMTSVPPG